MDVTVTEHGPQLPPLQVGVVTPAFFMYEGVMYVAYEVHWE
ncbi:hypothetical protein [Bacillus sp. FJAT-45350]|nr:hypothetical protein [Bacillus sp. FJAT-45350]